MAFKIDCGDIIAIFALLLSAYSTKKTFDFNKRQNEFIETNDKLNQLLLQKETLDAENQNSADLSANFIKVGTSKHRLKIYNKGKSTARNVRIEFPDGNELIVTGDIRDKFPVPILEEYQSVELIACVHNQSPSRLTVKLIWDDDISKDKTKVVTPTLVY